MNKAKREKVMTVGGVVDVPVPYRFLTPQGMHVDLRLFDR
jgi:hypothetical protein